MKTRRPLSTAPALRRGRPGTRNAARWDEESIFPRGVLAQAGELGLHGHVHPGGAAGGLGMSRLDASLIVEELARGCTATAAFPHHPQHGHQHDRQVLLPGGHRGVVPGPGDMGSKAGLLLPDRARRGFRCRRPCAPARCATVTTTWSTAARCSSPAPAIPMCWW